MNNLDSGKKLILSAERIMRRDMEDAFKENEYNMTVRRAQEVVELTLKGGLKILGIEYPKVHDIGKIFARSARSRVDIVDEETLKKIVFISTQLSKDRAPSFYGERLYGRKEAEEAYHNAFFVFNKVKELLNI